MGKIPVLVYSLLLGSAALAGCAVEATVDTANVEQELSCGIGSLQCCNVVSSANDPTVGLLLGLLGIVVPPNTTVGLTCTPLSPTGSCSTIATCCTNNNFNGLVALSCSQPNP
jgi:hypothetical protein